MKLTATMTAAELLAYVHAHGGRSFRYRRLSVGAGPEIKAPIVFVLTTDDTLAKWLRKHGAKPGGDGTERSYYRARDAKQREWDLVISGCTVSDEDPEWAIWEAAA